MKTTLDTPLSEAALPPSAPETVLVVDDQPALCEVAEMFLSRCGYHVLTAHNEREAMDIARRDAHIDLVLTDVEVPGIHGDELAEWFHVTSPKTAVVFMSEDPVEPRKLAEHPFIEKPFVHLDTLESTIRGTLKSQRRESHTNEELALAV
jgi:DNA-binding NtrC family response regulator